MCQLPAILPEQKNILQLYVFNMVMTQARSLFALLRQNLSVEQIVYWPKVQEIVQPFG